MYLFRSDLKEKSEVNINVPHKEVMMCLNESALDPFAVIKDEILKKMGQVHLNRYFNSITAQLYKELADYAEVLPENLAMGNGVDELLYYIFTAVRESKDDFALTFSPSYFDYKSYCDAVGLKIRQIDLEENFSNNFDKFIQVGSEAGCKLLILCNPNNPTGHLMPSEQIQRVLETANRLVLIDETYFEFSKVTYKEWINKYPNLIITRSFSKAFSAAGLRFGYVISAADNIKQLKKVITAFNLSLMTRTVALTILENREIFLNHTRKVVEMRNYICEELNKIPKMKATNTHTNFLILTIGDKTQELFKYLADNEIALRDVSAHPIMKNQIRVTISAPEENELFLKRVKDFMEKEEI